MQNFMQIPPREASHAVTVMRTVSLFEIFAVFDVRVFQCCRYQVYKRMFCTFILFKSMYIFYF